ncbi:putative DNA helicase [Gordonia polyisoprenivorans VH2]|uniref:Putative DNA helicase n=1 Tax=Gordonia polyisoprenivorans (strain DSM 44266 / VH2) TaxID=1112204 RepID=H6MX12_GORPV|nr:AAA domain-containing protein [Gordonia polyisoprenivorans]AFA72934.1 putative DNA helicase [Gordonia polyisoprenivorans VH2]
MGQPDRGPVPSGQVGGSAQEEAGLMAEQETLDDRRDQVVRLLEFLSDLLATRAGRRRHVDAHRARLDVGPGTAVTVRSGAAAGQVVVELDPGYVGYDELDAMITELYDHPESRELVVAGGLVVVTSVIGADSPDDGASELVREYLLTQEVVAQRDPDTGALRISLGAGSAPSVQDARLLAGIEGIDLSRTVKLHSRFEALPSVVSPKATDLLDEWIPRVDTDPDQVTVVVDPSATALVLRERSTTALAAFYDTVADRLRESTEDVPIGLAQLVAPIEVDERVEALAASGALPAGELVTDALYPLPSNVEQRDVLSRLGADSGVVVEGPPGTGKTQTIANVVAALLSKGQRVLVTSEKAGALAVLRDILPPELRALTVSTADLSRDRFESVVSGVEEIAERKATYVDSVGSAEIDDLSARRQQAVERRERALRGLWELRRSETEVHEWVAGDFSGTAAAIVRQTNADADRLDWLPGPIDGAFAPLDASEFRRLLELLRATRGQTPRLSQRFVDLDDHLPDPATMDQICARIARRPAEPMVGSGSLMSILGDVASPRLLHIKEICDHLGVAAHEVGTFPPTMIDMADRLLAGQAAHLWSRVTALSPVIADAARRDRELGAHSVVVDGARPGDGELFAAAAAHLRDGGRWRGRLRRSEEQRAVEESGVVVTVDGRPATDERSLQAVADHLAVFDAVHQAQRVLGDLHVPIDTSGSRSSQLNRLVLLDGQLGWISALVTARDDLVRELEVISPGGPRPRSVTEAARVAREAGAIAAANDALLAEEELAEHAYSLAAQLEKGPSPEGDALVSALANADAEAIRAARRAATVARTEWEDQTALDLLMLRLRSKAPDFADLLASTADDPRWDARLRDVSDAWAWRRARTWAAERSDPKGEQRWSAALDEAEADIAQLTTQLAAARAWRACLSRVTVAQVQALQSYRDHMINLGKGSGKHASRFRAAAREAMEQASAAVPAWVMPMSQVVDMIAPEQNSFDVVIVDEASQSDITSVFLLWLAPRVIVVGDDRQCAPTGLAGTTLDDAFAALDARLPDLPHYLRDGLTPRSSLFSLLRSRFGHVIRLREHFRSMPEIIGYSSAQFYADAPLIPVRQHGADRLDPLRTVRVSGIAQGQGNSIVNTSEVDELVSTLVECLADTAYDGLDFGVIALQGTKQVDLLTRALREAVDDETWRARRIRVGSPPDFQGDERRVVFLSMVVSDPSSIAALTRAESQRRINVAASRAMDQMWLFHSIDLADLGEGDLRRSLLGYMQANAGPAIDAMPVDVPDDRRVEPFESLFEQKIFNCLAAHGYHVIPKVSVNNMCIDLVVTGADGRLAVECDGDEFTTTGAQARSDMERERELRRCGWEFWRLRESEFELDADAALAPLWEALDRRGVKPGSVAGPYVGSTESAVSDGSSSEPAVAAWEPVDLSAGE